MTASSYSCILWDVDGTIADASRGIFSRITEVLDSYGLPIPAPDELRPWIGPPLIESFQQRAEMNPAQATEAVARFREFAARDGYASSVDLYPGIADLVRDTNAAGIPQSTASTKPENQVHAILEHFELLPEFTAISGARPGDVGRLDGKAFVVDQALKRLESAGADISRPVLIGDRHHDVEGGAEHGVPVIFVDWGFGGPGEAAGSIHTATNASELRAHLLN